MRLQKRFIPHLILYWWSEGEIRETIAEAKERLERMLRKMDVSFEKREELRESVAQWQATKTKAELAELLRQYRQT